MGSPPPGDSSKPCWDTVFFKVVTVPRLPSWALMAEYLQVEGTIFNRPRQEFVRHSSIFQDMYDVGDPTHGEGTTKNKPIILEGYKAVDFDALLKILYPRMEDVNMGWFDLTKEEWVGVLRLSRAWEMQKICHLAVETLSNLPFQLTPLEKVGLARDHKVASWLVQGLTSLTFGPPELSPTDLEASVGLATAFRIVSIRAKASSQRDLSPITVKGPSRKGKPGKGKNTILTGVNLRALRCGDCLNPLITTERKCAQCPKIVNAAAPYPFCVVADAGRAHLESSNHEAHLSIDVDLVRCSACGCHILGTLSFNCESCAKSVNFGDKVRICLTSKPSLSETESMVQEIFKDEISEYDL